MPNVNSKAWTGRLGEWAAFHGPDFSAVKDYGAVLHLYKYADDSERSVKVVYHQAASDAPGLLSRSPRLRPGGVFSWDKDDMKAIAPVYSFVPGGVQLQTSLSGWQEAGLPGLFRVVRLLPQERCGFILTHVALQPTFGPEFAAQQPPGSFWWVQGMVQQDLGGQQSCTVAVSYDWATGQLTAHRNYWERVTHPVGELEDERAARGADVAVVGAPQAADASITSVAGFYKSSSLLPAEAMVYSYDAELQLTAQKLPPGSWDFEESGAGTAMVDLWYAEGSYLRVPVDLQKAIAEAPYVSFEIGAAMTDGSLQRFVLRFSTRGQRLLADMTHELYSSQGQGGLTPQ